VTYPAPDDGLKPASAWVLLAAVLGYAVIGFVTGGVVVALIRAVA
jgi:hypothetical protein